MPYILTEQIKATSIQRIYEYDSLDAAERSAVAIMDKRTSGHWGRVESADHMQGLNGGKKVFEYANRVLWNNNLKYSTVLVRVVQDQAAPVCDQCERVAEYWQGGQFYCAVHIEGLPA